MNPIGIVIRSRREELGITVAELARGVGVTTQAVWNWENNPNRAPAREHLSRIAEILTLKLEQLLKPAPNHLESEEAQLLKSFRSLTDPERRLVLRMFEGLKNN